MASKIEISPPLDERKITKSPSRHEVTFSEIEKKEKITKSTSKTDLSLKEVEKKEKNN